MNTVDNICCNVNGALKTKCFICTPKVIVDCFWQRNNIQALFTQEVCSFLCAVSAENNKAVKLKFLIVLFHFGNFINAVFVNNSHKFERLS